ncbi:hypothetical protein ACFQ6V_12980 [Streptomyces roseifaciens]
MWAALITMCGYVPVPLSGADWLELLPVRWQPITERGIRIDYRTYDHEVLDPHRGRRSDAEAKDGKWEVHHNPHDARQIWARLGDGKLHEIPWIHRDHVHQPFNDQTWRHIQGEVAQRGEREQHEADLADALDQLLRRTRGAAAGTPPKRRGRKSPITTPGSTAVLEGLDVGLPAPRWPSDLESGRAMGGRSCGWHRPGHGSRPGRDRGHRADGAGAGRGMGRESGRPRRHRSDGRDRWSSGSGHGIGG